MNLYIEMIGSLLKRLHKPVYRNLREPTKEIA